MKAMVSQPMSGKTDDEIIATRDRAIAALTEKGYEIVNTLFTDELSRSRFASWQSPLRTWPTATPPTSARGGSRREAVVLSTLLRRPMGWTLFTSKGGSHYEMQMG